MRLTAKEVSAIKKAVEELDPSAKVYLYGSRANDSLKGGDIDLLVVSDKMGFAEKVSALARIKEQIGEQRLDLIIKTEADVKVDPFVLSILPSAVGL